MRLGNSKGYMSSEKFQISQSDYLEYKKKRLARKLVTKSISSGKLVRASACQLCKKEGKTNAHHIDYGKPLEVIWLCSACHGICHTNKHPLNPKNNLQTLVHNIWERGDAISVSFQIPHLVFLALKKDSQESKKSISFLLRKIVESAYPVENNQLEFNFEAVNNDNAQDVANENLQSVGKDKGLLQQSKRTILPFIRGQGDFSLQGMGGKFFKISRRYGRDARDLQWNSEIRQHQGVL